MHWPAPLTAQQIAAGTKVSAPYLSKVLQSLVKAKLIQSQRGINGGFTLAKNPEHISILDVINAVDPIVRITTCPLEIDAHGTVLCALHRRLDDAIEIIEKTFAATTIGDLLARPTGSTPLCAVPK